MTRIFIAISILFFSYTSQSQLNYNDFRGKWQERTRLGSNGTISFNDTLMLDFSKRDTVVLRNGSGVNYRGAAVFEKDTLYASAIPFKVLQVSRNRMVLQDSTGKRTLVKVKRFHHENLGIKAVAAEDLSDPKNVSLRSLSGTWDVFRTEAAPGVAEDSIVIRQLRINAGGKAEVDYQSHGNSYTHQATLEKSGTSFNLKRAGSDWPFQVYKADKKEMVFGNHGGIVYFARRRS